MTELVAMSRVAAAFDLGTPIAVASVARGAMGRISRLRTSTGEFAVKELFWETDEETVRRGVELRDAAVRAGLLAPRPVATIDGHYLHGMVRVFDWVAGAPVGPDHVERASWTGHALGTIHSLRMTGGEPDPWNVTCPTDDRWADLVERGAGQPWQVLLRDALPQLRTLATLVAPVEADRLVLSHGDIQPANTLVSDAGIFLLDWDNTGPCDPGRELGSLLHTWHVRDEIVDATSIGASMAAYRATGGHGVVSDIRSFASLAAAHLNYIYGQASLTLDSDDASMRDHAATEACAALADPPSLQCFEQIVKAAA